MHACSTPQFNRIPKLERRPFERTTAANALIRVRKSDGICGSDSTYNDSSSERAKRLRKPLRGRLTAATVAPRTPTLSPPLAIAMSSRTSFSLREPGAKLILPSQQTSRDSHPIRFSSVRGLHSWSSHGLETHLSAAMSASIAEQTRSSAAPEMKPFSAALHAAQA